MSLQCGACSRLAEACENARQAVGRAVDRELHMWEYAHKEDQKRTSLRILADAHRYPEHRREAEEPTVCVFVGRCRIAFLNTGRPGSIICLTYIVVCPEVLAQA
jgi:hypothetical protein